MHRALTGVAIAAAVLATLAVAKSTATSRAHTAGFWRSVMRSELRDLADSQAAYHRVHGAFARSVPAEQQFRGGRIVIERADSAGWRATAYNERTRDRCSFGGAAAGPLAPVVSDSAPACMPP